MSATAVSRTIETWRQWTGKIVDGKYRLGQYLGGSNHSAVFLTEYGKGDGRRKAAIKLIPDAAGEEAQLAGWEAAQALSHPHLLSIFDKGQCELEDARLLYVVMEYAEEDLSQILPGRPLTPQEAREMLKPVLQALAYLHSKGRVHGHIKPANILAVQDQVRISSDSLVDPADPGPLSPEANPYSAPELWQGRISPASDVWSLGATLVEALTQSSPTRNGGRRNLVTPETLPQPFLDIARNSLLGDETRRWTIAQIAWHLEPAEFSLPVKQPVAAPPKKRVAKRKYLPLSLSTAFVVAVLLGTMLFRPSVKPTSSLQETANNPARSDGAKTAAAGLVPGAVAQQVLPDVSRGARNTVQGKIRIIVRVSVDPTGNVAGAAFQVMGPSQYFARKTMEAARDWKFTPPEVDGKPLASEWSLRFAIGRTGTEVYPSQIAPAR
jgi:serine/threonine protein kinase